MAVKRVSYEGQCRMKNVCNCILYIRKNDDWVNFRSENSAIFVFASMIMGTDFKKKTELAPIGTDS